MKKILFIFIEIYLLAVSGIVIAQGVSRNSATAIPSLGAVMLPDKAIDNFPILERITFIHYKKGFAKPGTECGNGICEPGENARKCPQDCGGGDLPQSGCYGFLEKGFKIKSTKDLVIHPTLNALTIVDSLSEWDYHTSTELFGGHTVDETANWDGDVPDGRNEFSYGNYPEQGVIAVAVVWGYFSGPPWAREIIEFDVLFDTDYDWGDASQNPSLMDLENIAVHEIGHGLGLKDIYENTCSEVTMYGYSDYGEIKKRSIEQPDIIGLQELYGN